MSVDTDEPKDFTRDGIVNYLSEKYNLSRRVTGDLYSDLFDAVAKGVVQGNRLRLGNLGNIYSRVRPATSQRKGRNPSTGEEITIEGKPEMNIPRMSFFKGFKEMISEGKQ